jgi:hypothetical protein
MAWVILNSTDVLNSLTDAEQQQMAAASSAMIDLNNIVLHVTNLVRGKVNAAKRNQGHLGPVGTIPDELYAAAVAISRFKLLTHLPGTQLITPDRRQDKDEAFLQLHDVALGVLTIIKGDDVGYQSVLGIYGEVGNSTLNPTLWPYLTQTGVSQIPQIPWEGGYW